VTPAVKALQHARVAFEVHEYTHDARSESFGLEAADALDLDPACVYKTLLARLDGRELVVAIVPVAGTLDLKALARVARAKRAEMANPAQAQRSTGYVLGGISPFGQKKRLRTFVDESALAVGTVHVSGGRRGLEIAISPSNLIAVTEATCVDIASR